MKYSLFCSNDNTEDYLLNSDNNPLNGASYSITVTKCKGDGCASGDEINRFVNNVVILTSAVFDSIDFSIRDRKPVF